MTFTSRLSCLLLTALFALPAVGLGEETAKQLLAKAYAKTKSAKTEGDYTSIIDLCRQAQATELTASSRKYAKQLLAWAFNRRGEAYVNRAANVLEAGEADRAAALDAKALNDFEAAIENDPMRWKAIHNRGVSKAIASKYQSAIEDFSRVVELKPDYLNAWFNRAEIQYELGEFQEAIEDYNEVLKLQPEDVGAITSRGHAQFKLGQFSNALDDYTQVTELDDQNADAFANRGDAYQGLQMWEEAAADFRHAIELDPSSPRAYQAASWLMVTCPEARFRNVKLGLSAAKRAVALEDTNTAMSLDTLAAAQANAGRFEEASKTVLQAIKLASADIQAELKSRLKLYNSEQPYRQPETARVATREESSQ